MPSHGMRSGSADGGALRNFSGHRGGIAGATLSSDGHRWMTGSKDGTLLSRASGRGAISD